MKIWLSAIGVFILWSAAVVAAQGNPFVLNGEIKDEFGGLIVGATVILSRQDGASQTTTTDKQGIFRFERLSNGTYTLQISAEGFAAREEKLELSAATKPAQLSITLYPTIQENVEVNETSKTTLTPERAEGTQVLSAKELENFLDDPDQLIRQLKNIAVASGGIPGTEAVTVDGFSTGKVPPKSSIQQVRIIPFAYSAEYQTPGTRIEITTKPGAESLNGAIFLNYNGTALNARDPLAIKRADTQTRLYGFDFGTPVIKNRAGFFLNFEKRDINEESIVNAIVLDSNFQLANFIFNSPSPQRLILGAARADWLVNQNNTLSFRYNFNSNKSFGQGIGGTTLPESGFDSQQTENSFRLNETAVINPRTVNELRVGFTLNEIEQNALNSQTAITVAGSFASGGAGVQQSSRSEKRLEIVDGLTTSIGNHTLKFGVQIFNNRISELDVANTNGSFFFGGATVGGLTIPSLEQYRRALLGLPGGTPTRFFLTTGAPRVSVNQWLFAAYFQEQWKVNPKVLVNLGLRFEAQTAPNDAASFAPRLNVAYTPDKNKKWILRASAGIFYERFNDSLNLEVERLDGRRQQQIIIDAPSFPNPFGGSGAVGNPVQTIRIFDSDLPPPRVLQMGVGFERSLPQGWRMSASFGGVIGWHRLRSRNINAPFVSVLNPDPRTAPRPFGTLENILQFESSGRQRGTSFSVNISQSSNKFFTLNFSYINLNYRTDADYYFALPQSSYDSAGEWARPFWLARHRIFASATANLPYKLHLSAWLNATSGTPYNITTGRDNNGDGNFNDRPHLSSSTDSQAVPTIFGFLNPNFINGNFRRNTGTNPALATLDVNLSRVFAVGKKPKKGESRYKLTVNISASNLLNRANLTGTNGVLSSPLFGRATTANPSRRIQFGLRFSF